MVVGDFNEIFFGCEASGVRLRDSASMRRFREIANDCGLIDMGYNGSRFTFTNKRLYPNEYKACLDRVLVNLHWKELFSSASVCHGTATRSDHCPIITNLKNSMPSHPRKIFRYEAMWHRHNQFSAVIQEVWSKSHRVSNSLTDTLTLCAQELHQWNKCTFGHVNKEIARLKTQLEYSRSLDRTSSTSVREKALVSQLDEWFEREELMWQQRSRVDWLREGDRNSKYFHAKASQRRATNRITTLRNEDGIEVYSQDEMKQVSSRYFDKLFASELIPENIDWSHELQIVETKVTAEMNAGLLEPITNEEIRMTLFQMSPSKAPGLDGFPALFFQNNWSIVGEAVCAEVRQILNDGIISDESNLTRIALIPKCKNAVDMASFRPISLCPVIMRLSSKIIASRLQAVLPAIISENQSAFIRGRLISDNILIAHELSHFIKSRRGKTNGMASLKLDMSKAFDRLEWLFIEKMLSKLGFADQWVQMVMRCVRSVSYKAQINGELTDTIIPSRGIRQGDPMSPYLFIICSEWLSAALKNEVKGIKIAKDAPYLSHLFFADDSLVFSKANTAMFTRIKHILLSYQRISGQCVNYQKSEVVFSPNVDVIIKHAICGLLNIPEVAKHSQYLGLPLVVGQSKQVVFRYIEERSHHRVADWKSKLLSSAGKEILIKSVLQAIPQYSMLCYKLPRSTCSRLMQLWTRYWWSNNGSSNPAHWIRRDVLFSNKDQGGLGLRCPLAMNDALLLKQVWRILVEPSLLLSRIFKAKYFQSADLFNATVGHSPSHAWRSMFKIRSALLHGMEWTNDSERPYWKLSICGDFTTKSAYHLIRESSLSGTAVLGESSNPMIMRKFWGRFWKLQLPGKIKIFGRRAIHNSLPVGANLRSREINSSNECIFCGWNWEDENHIFRDCWRAKAVGDKLSIPTHIYSFSGGSPADWFYWCARALCSKNFRVLLCASWCIWLCRNELHHGKKDWGLDYIQAKVYFVLSQWDKFVSMRGTCLIEDDDISHTRVFCDGSWIPSTGLTGLAALCSVNGELQALYADARYNVRCSRDAEGEALLLGLHLASSLKLERVTFFSDSVEVISAIFSGLVKGPLQPTWVATCSCLLEAHKRWKVQHCFREDNHRADAVAGFTRSTGWSWKFLDALPRIDPLYC